MIRRSILWLSEQRRIFRFLRSNTIARRFARRFVAGETVADATAAAQALAGQGIAATLDLLGESVQDAAASVGARDQVAQVIEQMAQDGLAVNVSVKPTQMGLSLDPDLCRQNFTVLLKRVQELDGFLRLDMEGSAYTQTTLDLFEQHLHPTFGDHVGVVIQSALRRSPDDIERLIKRRARVRLVKGAYLEPDDIAFPDKADVDRTFQQLMERLLSEGNDPAIATHDETLLKRAQSTVARDERSNDRFEFQMLYGVRRDLQSRLRASGYRVRVYIPFGTQWYPYLMRRLAERPANIAFILGNMIREGI